MKNEIVKFVRHIRPIKNGMIDNNAGSTIFVCLDYKDKSISFSEASVTETENFNKKIGRTVAENRFKKGLFKTIPMTNGKVSEEGVLVELAVQHQLNGKLFSQRTWKNFKNSIPKL